jgi:short-subunit dehydrogenase
MYDLNNKTVIVTGASSGIGWHTARLFAQQGSKVALVARSKDKLESLKHQIEADGGTALVSPTDILNLDQVAQMLQDVLKTFGPVDVLVNNAGVGAFRKVTDSIGTVDFHQMMNINYHAPVILTQLVLPLLIKNGSGQIINVSSLLGKRAMPFMAAYSASKYALNGFTQALRAEVMHENVDIILVNPAVTRTAFFSKASPDHGEGMLSQMPGVMEPDAVAKAIVNASRKQKREVTLSTYGRWFIRLSRWFPRMMDNMIAKQVGGTYESQKQQTNTSEPDTKKPSPPN